MSEIVAVLATADDTATLEAATLLLADRVARASAEVAPWVDTLRDRARTIGHRPIRKRLEGAARGARLAQQGIDPGPGVARLSEADRQRLLAALFGSSPAVQGLPSVLREDYEPAGDAMRGGFGIVHPRHDLVRGGLVAVKVLRSDLTPLQEPIGRQRFARERLIHARLQEAGGHPHVVPLVDHLQHRGEDVLVLRWAHGGSLRQLIDAQPGGLPEARCRDLLLQALSALGWLHAADVVHRDLKPENLLLADPPGAPDRIWLSDFGSALDGAMSRATRLENPVPQTPRYAAPEQLASGGDADARADLFALGVVAFELLVGRQRLPREPLDLQAERPPLAPRWQAFLDAMTASEPNDRPADAGAALALLPRGTGGAGCGPGGTQTG